MFLEISRENTCARVSFLIKRLWHRCFPVNLAKFLTAEHLRWLLLIQLPYVSSLVETNCANLVTKSKLFFCCYWQMWQIFLDTLVKKCEIIVHFIKDNWWISSVRCVAAWSIRTEKFIIQTKVTQLIYNLYKNLFYTKICLKNKVCCLPKFRYLKSSDL